MAVDIGGFPKPVPRTASAANKWNQAYPAPTLQSGPAAPVGLTPPAVPTANGGTGGVSVNTDVLSTVADNMNTLYETVKAAYSQLNDVVPIAPGAFWDANQLKTTVGSPGDGSTSDLVNSYLAVLIDLGNGLADIQNSLLKMQSTYSTFDALNQVSVSDLDNDLSAAQSDFTDMMTAAGGSGGATTGGTGPAGGTGSGGSGSAGSGSAGGGGTASAA